MIAVSRLLLDNIPYQSLLDHAEPPLAQLSLEFGADDIDGTVVQEKITMQQAKPRKGLVRRN